MSDSAGWQQVLQARRHRNRLTGTSAVRILTPKGKTSAFTLRGQRRVTRIEIGLSYFQGHTRQRSTMIPDAYGNNTFLSPNV
jgi:hypothetical protein